MDLHYWVFLRFLWAFHRIIYLYFVPLISIKISPGQCGSVCWLECCPVDRKIMGSVPSRGTYPGCGFNLWLGCIWESSQSVFLFQVDVSRSPPSSVSRGNEKMSLSDNFKKMPTKITLSQIGCFSLSPSFLLNAFVSLPLIPILWHF